MWIEDQDVWDKVMCKNAILNNDVLLRRECLEEGYSASINNFIDVGMNSIANEGASPQDNAGLMNHGNRGASRGLREIRFCFADDKVVGEYAIVDDEGFSANCSEYSRLEDAFVVGEVTIDHTNGPSANAINRGSFRVEIGDCHIGEQ